MDFGSLFHFHYHRRIADFRRFLGIFHTIDMDKINIFSSQTVLVVSTFSMDTHSMSSSPLVNSLIKSRLFKTTPDIKIHPHYRFVCGRHDAAWQSRSHNPQETYETYRNNWHCRDNDFTTFSKRSSRHPDPDLSANSDSNPESFLVEITASAEFALSRYSCYYYAICSTADTQIQQ